MSNLHHSPLGKTVGYAEHYDPSLLFILPREEKRREIGVHDALPFHGVDIWNAYELSWLNPHGKPLVAGAVLTVPCDTPNIFESKSLKLYFNSFTQTQFNSATDVQHTIETDLSKATGGKVKVKLILPSEFAQQKLQELPGMCLDDLDVKIDCYQPTATLLQTHTTKTSETLMSRLLKSNCPITTQPDWASVMIKYTGNKIDHASLLKYIISFRQNNEFHEQCVERIFMDVMMHCQPKKLTVYARYTRRGGIDINPFRSNDDQQAINYRGFQQ